ncbi:MAG: hypothetical protein ACLUKN_14120 [Bacilli bacterium]
MRNNLAQKSIERRRAGSKKRVGREDNGKGNWEDVTTSRKLKSSEGSRFGKERLVSDEETLNRMVEKLKAQIEAVGNINHTAIYAEI